MRFRTLVMLLLTGQVLSGCTHIDRPIIQPVPPIQDESKSATIVVARRSMWLAAADSVYISIDGVPVARLRSGQHTRFRVDAGQHQLGLYTTEPLYSLPTGHGNKVYWVLYSSRSVDAEPSELVYVVVEPIIGIFNWQISIVKELPDYIDLTSNRFVASGVK